MYRLLIADDEARIRNGLAEHFPWDDLGFSVVGLCANGKAAKAFIQANPVDVVLTDIRMPVMDGLALAEFLFDQYPAITIVFLSGYSDFEYAQKALRFAVKEYMLKPLKYEKVISTFSALRKTLDARATPSEEDKGYYDRIVELVKDYVLANFNTATLEGAAAAAELSPNYLSRIFKRQTGVTFGDFLLDTKMRKAVLLLDDVHLKIYNVSEALGYDNPKNFARAFKRSCGKTPRQFRQGSVKE